jgi:hypothetical protein
VDDGQADDEQSDADEDLEAAFFCLVASLQGRQIPTQSRVVSIGRKTRVGPLNIRVDRVIYTTITLLCVLII